MPLADHAFDTTLALIIVFVVVMGGLVNGLIMYAVVQVLGERKANKRPPR